MLKWTLRIVVLLVVAWIGFATYVSYRGGYHTSPPLEEGEFTASFQNGLRGVVSGGHLSDIEPLSIDRFNRLFFSDSERRYLSVVFDVPEWFEDAWSNCTLPTAEERSGILASLGPELARSLQSARFDFVCKLTLDDQVVYRGVIFSVPRL